MLDLVGLPSWVEWSPLALVMTVDAAEAGRVDFSSFSGGGAGKAGAAAERRLRLTRWMTKRQRMAMRCG